MKVAVVGCGYVGLISGVGLATAGHDVVGIEQDSERLARIESGNSPFHEPGLAEALMQTQEAGTFRVSANLGETRQAAVVLLCVQTPPDPTGSIDLGPLRRASADLAALPLVDHDQRKVVVVRSTVVPGTVQGVVLPGLLSRGADPAALAVAANPEFLREGTALQDFLDPDRVLLGCEEAWAREVLEKLYAPLGAPIVTTGVATAELTKYASNALLSTMISFSNEIARLAEATPGVDAEHVFDVLHLDRRLRPRVAGQLATPPGIVSYLRPGCGFGGSCLPKDVAALAAYGKAVGEDTPMLDAVLAVNGSQPRRLVDLGERALGDLRGRPVAVLGAAFKGGTDDLRASPGLAVVEELLSRGSEVVLYDPIVQQQALAGMAQRGVRVAQSLLSAVHGVDAVFVTSNSEEFCQLPELLSENGPIVVDGRRILAPNAVSSGYYGIGLAPSREEAGVGR
jgi:UDPglucose 6-dehydrogenase